MIDLTGQEVEEESGISYIKSVPFYNDEDRVRYIHQSPSLLAELFIDNKSPQDGRW